MKILLEELPHQEKSLENLIKAFPPLDKHTTDPDKDFVYANPILHYRDRDDKNIDIKMETGERVIIVTGCINALVSRVSGTLIKNNSCIA